MVIIIVLFGILIGVLLGAKLPIPVPMELSKYLSLAILAGVDSIFGGLKAYLQKNFDYVIFISGFIFNGILAALLAFLGDQLGIDLYLAAVIVFGFRLFQNMAVIRRSLFGRST